VTALLTILHVVICLVLVAAVLLQSGKAADLAGAFGGGGSATAFGPRGTQSIMAKLTTISAVLFMVTSIGLSLVSTPEKKSRMEGADAGKPPAAQTQEKPSPAPTQPAPKPAEPVKK
jgi:preprotein translocase subunit SecG